MDASSVNEGKPLAFSYRRFSSAQQKDGNSIKRQTDAAQAWCDANGYELSSSNFEDLGVSAFKGANAEVGALLAGNQESQRGRNHTRDRGPRGSTVGRSGNTRVPPIETRSNAPSADGCAS